MTDEGRLKVLVSAYACEPHRGSEPGVGWNWAVQAAKHHDVWVLVWSIFREPIEREMALNPHPHLHFVYYGLPKWVQRLPLSERHFYLLWQFFVLPLARRLHRRERFDVVHHLTQGTLEVPGMLWSLDAPFVWGPVGGGQVPPAALKDYFLKLWPVERVRAARKHLVRFNPMVRIAMSRAAGVIASNPDTAERLESLARRPMVIETESAVTLPPEPSPMPDSIFTISWWGVLIPRKGPLLALDVAAELKRRDVPFRLNLGGEGPWLDLLKQRVRELGLQEQVLFPEGVSFEMMSRFYQDSHAFLFTSLQDTTGMVTIEAMANGRPVVCLDHQGASVVVTPETGIKVPVGSKHDVVQGFADALERLAGDRELCARLGAAARRRVIERYTWEHKAGVVDRVYAEAVRHDQTPAPTRLEPVAPGARP